MAVSIWTEIVYDTITRVIIATQEWNRDRGEDHDWSLQKDQAFIRISGSLPIGDISGKLLNITNDGWDDDPSYLTPTQRKQAEIDTVNAADDVSKLQAILVQMIEEKYA